jgi:hypothetical protein
MAEGHDVVQGVALATVAGVVTLVTAGVLALAASRGLDGSLAEQPLPAAASQPYGPGEQIVFEDCSAALPADAMEPIARIAEAARAHDGEAVLSSSRCRAEEAAPAERALAQRRALALCHALEADGVPAARLFIVEPLPAVAGAEPRKARRAEL